MGGSSTILLSTIGILVMIDVLFMCNYCFVRSLRKLTDQFSRKEIDVGLVWRIDSTAAAQKLGKFFAALRRNIDRKKKAISKAIEVCFGCLLGTHRLEKNSVETFPGWKPIPKYLDLISTSVTLLIATFLLSPDIINQDVATVLQGRSNKNGGFCATDEFEEKIRKFEDRALGPNLTNYRVATRQFNHTKAFNNAFVTDTTLFGETAPPSPVCGSKQQYNDNGKYVTSRPFFPGYCEEALKASLELARSQKCSGRKRVCIDRWGLSILCKTITIPVPCPPSTWDAEQQAPNNYRQEQYRISLEQEVEISDDGPDPDDIVSLGNDFI